MANRIKEAMKSRGYQSLMPNDAQLNELHASKTKWSRWVSGTDDPDFWQVPIIARVIGCSIEELFPEDEKEDPEEAMLSKFSIDHTK